MKYLVYIIWSFGILAGLIILLGVIDFFFKIELVRVNHVINYFQVASTFLLVCIGCTLYLIWKKKEQA